MKVLVTGASGGLGGHVIRKLADDGHEVVATARRYPEDLAHNKRIAFVAHDLSDRKEDNLMKKFDNPDTIIHLAWDKLKDHKSEAHVTTILEDHKFFLSNLVSNGLNDMNIVGTCYEYGLREGMLRETDPAEPVIAYGIGKNMLRIFAEKLCSENSVTFKWLRVFNVFSNGKGGGNLYSLINNAVNEGHETFNMSGGMQVRDYLTAAQVGNLIVELSLQKKVTGIINCASGVPVRLKDLVNDFIVSRKSSIKLNLGYYPYLSHEPMEHWASTEKMQEALGRKL